MALYASFKQKLSPKRKYTNSLVNVTFGSGKKLCWPNFVFTMLGPDIILSLNANFVVHIKQDGNFFKLSVIEIHVKRIHVNQGVGVFV